MEQIVDFPNKTRIYAYSIDNLPSNRNILFAEGTIIYGLFEFAATILLHPQTVGEYEEEGFPSITTQVLFNPIGTDKEVYLKISQMPTIEESYDLRMQVSLSSILIGLISETNSYDINLKSKQKVWIPLKLLNAYKKVEGDLVNTFYFFCPYGNSFTNLTRSVAIVQL